MTWIYNFATDPLGIRTRVLGEVDLQPWVLAKSPDTRTALETTLGTLVRSLARQAVMLFPFVPTKARDLWRQLGAPGRIEDQRFDSLMQLDATGWRIRKGDPMFPKPVTAS